jgi:FkbM family methyltransferase
MFGRIGYKLQQCAAFIRGSRTPLPLVLDSLKLKRRPFEAIDAEGTRLRLEPGAGDSFTFFEIMIRHDYLRHGITLRPGDTVVDIGANFGAFSTLAARIVGPSGKVFSFEPSPLTYQRLIGNLALNGLSHVEAFPEAVGGEAGSAILHMNPKSALSSIFEAVDGRLSSTGSTHGVAVRTLGEFLEFKGIERVDLLKIDCEGAEYGILDSLSPQTAARIRQISMEVHKLPGRSTQELSDRLDALGFDVQPSAPMVAFNRDRAAVEARSRPSLGLT